ncbi:MAG: M20/M25/M40 family metallo-hydrolase [Acetobacter sp.]|nr:M20/M25/M40 family metallo-hydrolase [Acetobacter sp.]
MKTAKEFLADLIAIKTDGLLNGVQQCVDYICDVLQQNDVLFERVPHIGNSKESVVAVVNAPQMRDVSGGLVLSGHIDVVSANEEEWKTPPFELTAEEGKLFGRGTVDMKYFAAVLLAALSELKKAENPVFLVFTSDEETDVCGARAVTSFFKERNIHPEYALIGEPTNFKICVANKGYAGYKTVVKGIAAHSSAPELGVNAVYVAAKMISEIERLNAVYMPLGTTLNVGVVNGGKERNSIADEAVIDWEIRYVAEEHKASILQELDVFSQRLVEEYLGADIKLLAQETLPAFVEKKDGRLTGVAMALLQTEQLTLKYATEAGFFQQAGIETIICGAGDEGLAHTSAEYILEEDLERYDCFLRDFVAHL